MTFSIGDAIILSSDGGTFDTYHSWHDITHVPRFTYGGCPVVGRAYTITYVGVHSSQWSEIVYVLDGEFIVDGRYIHLIKEKRDGLQSACNYEIREISRPRTGGWMADSRHFHVSPN